MTASTSAASAPTALILSGGGARAAYQVGVLRAIADMLPPGAPLPFPIVCGNSAGALNAAFLAADARHFDRATRSLDQLWTALVPEAIYRTESMVLLVAAQRMVRAFFRGGSDSADPPALLDTAPLAALLARTVDFAGIQKNIDEAMIKALAITAFSYNLARSVTFCQTTPDQPMWARVPRMLK